MESPPADSRWAFSLAAKEIKGKKKEIKMKELQSFSTRAEAEMACDILKGKGIPSIIKADDCGGLRPSMAFASGGYIVYVEEGDYSEALKLIAPL